MKKVFKTENLLALTVFLLPIYLWRFSIFGLSTNALEILILTTIIAWFFNGGIKIKLAEKISINKSLLLYIILIFFGLFVSTIIAGNFKIGLGIIKGWFLLPFGLAVTTLLLEKKKKTELFQVFYFSALGVSVLALAGFFLGFKTYDQRLAIPFNSPNYLAMYLAPAVLIGILFLRQNRKIYTATLAIIITTLYLTFSYAAWAAILLSLAFLTVFVTQPGMLKSYGKRIIMGLIIIALFFLSQPSSPKFKGLINISERSSLASRAMIWKSAGKIIADNFIFGIGPGNFQEKYLEYQKYFPPYLEWAVPHPHSLYLAFWLSGGLLSLLGFFGLIFLWLKKIIRAERDMLWMISLSIISYFLIHGFVDTTYFKNDLAVIFWLALLAIF